MSNNPFALSGSELLDPFGGRRASSKEIFSSPKSRGGMGRVRKPEPESPEPEEELIPEAMQPPAAEGLEVILSNPGFLKREGHFEEAMPFSVDAELPPELKDVRRVIITAWACLDNGDKRQVHTRDFYIDEGKVTGEIELRRPARASSKDRDPCPYIFTAKHRDSKEVASPRIRVSDSRSGSEELVLELDGAEEISAGGYSFELRSMDGTFLERNSPKRADTKDGKITIEFKNLNNELEFTLEVFDSEGMACETLFKDSPFGQWDGTAA